MKTPDPKNTPPVFYTEQELGLNFLKDPDLTVPTMPTMHDAPCRLERITKRAIGKQAPIGLGGNMNQSGLFATEEPPEEAHSHPDPTPVTAGIERPASVPPILGMNGVEAEAEAGARANPKRKRGQFWDYCHEKRMVRMRVMTKLCLVPMSANARGLSIVGVPHAGVLGTMRSGLGQRYVLLVISWDGVCSFSSVLGL